MSLGAGIVKNYKSVKSGRQVFDSYYEELRRFFDITADNIVQAKTPGAQLNVLYEAPGIRAADVIAAGLSAYLTPETQRWCALEHPNPRLNEFKEVKKFFQDTTDELFYRLSRSNFYDQRHINHRSSPVYGTSAFMREFDPLDGIRFINIPIKAIYIVDDHNGRPYEIYFSFDYTAVQAFSKFGSKVSDEIRQSYATARNEEKKHEYVYYIGPNLERDPEKIDNKNMPLKAAWVEVKTGNVMLETGYNRMPCSVHRFYKRSGVSYGYSPAMIALPTTRLANKIRETMLTSDMMDVSPHTLLPHDAFLGSRLNLNPKGVTFYDRKKMSPAEDIMRFTSGGNQQIALNNLEMCRAQISEFMFSDVFAALSNVTKQMTVPEVQQRIDEAMIVIGPAVSRYYAEDLTPTIEGTVISLFENGYLPPIPDVMQEDPDFSVKFVGRLMNAQKMGEIQNLLSGIGEIAQIAQFKPEVLDKIDGDKAVDEIISMRGIDVDVLNSDIVVQQLRTMREEAQQAQAQMGAMQQGLDMYETAQRADAAGNQRVA